MRPSRFKPVPTLLSLAKLRMSLSRGPRPEVA
jgi:hypothetical protein